MKQFLLAATLCLLVSAPAAAQRSFGTLVVVEVGPIPVSPSPLSAVSPEEWRVVELLYAPLFVPARDGYEPWLAQKVTPSDEGRTLTVSLHPDAAWSNGRDVGPLDVVYTYELARQGKWNGAWTELLAPIESVRRAADGFDVVFELSDPVEEPERLLSVPILPSGLHGSLEDPARQRPLPMGALGAGPYKVVEGGAGNRFTINEHSLKKPRISEVRILSAGTPALAGEYVRMIGDAVTFHLAPEDALIARTEHGSNALRGTQQRLIALAWRPGQTLLSDPSVLRAVRHAISREELFVPGESARPTAAPVTRASPAYPRDLAIPARDAVAARSILWWSDWEREWGEPYFVRRLEQGQTERAAIPLLVDADDQQQLRRAAVLKRRLAEAGVELKVDPRPHHELMSRIRSREFPAALLSLDASGPHMLRRIFHSKGADNVVRFSSDTVDAALAAGDDARAVAEVVQEAPMLFLGTVERIGAAGRNVTVPYLSGPGGLSRVDRWRIR